MLKFVLDIFFICPGHSMSKMFAEHFTTNILLNIGKKLFCFIINEPKINEGKSQRCDLVHQIYLGKKSTTTFVTQYLTSLISFLILRSMQLYKHIRYKILHRI